MVGLELVLEGGPYDTNGFDSSHVCALDPILWRFAISDQYGDGEFYSDRIHGIKILVDASSLTLFRSVKSYY